MKDAMSGEAGEKDMGGVALPILKVGRLFEVNRAGVSNMWRRASLSGL